MKSCARCKDYAVVYVRIQPQDGTFRQTFDYDLYLCEQHFNEVLKEWSKDLK